MKEDQEENGGAWVPSAGSALTTKSNGLVRRGLNDLMGRTAETQQSAPSNPAHPDPWQELRELAADWLLNCDGPI